MKHEEFQKLSPEDILKNIHQKHIPTLARAITLVESTLPEHQEKAFLIMDKLWKNQKSENTIRLAISGAPGAGKSTLIQNIATLITQQNQRVAVLAIDPSSHISGGSILGDKTRMHQLAQNPHVFIRPSPTRGMLGGVNGATRETIALCEWAQFDVIIVETVGTGQSEIMAANMTDAMLLVMIPGAGDDLQGIKKGIMEQANIMAINKIDLDEKKAQVTAQFYQKALHIIQHHQKWKTPVICASALNQTNTQNIWTNVLKFIEHQKKENHFHKIRQEQKKDWMWDLIKASLMKAILQNNEPEKIQHIQNQMMENHISPHMAAKKIMQNKENKE